jgi:allantoinase
VPDLVVRAVQAVVGEPGRRRLAHADLMISDGRTFAVPDAGTAPRGRSEISGDGLLALPGLVDAHVHFNDPGREGWASGSAAAAAGGVTTVVDTA